MSHRKNRRKDGHIKAAERVSEIRNLKDVGGGKSVATSVDSSLNFLLGSGQQDLVASNNVVNACVSKIAYYLSAIPLRVFEMVDGHWEMRPEHYYSKLFTKATSKGSSTQKIQSLIYNKLVYGSSFLILQEKKYFKVFTEWFVVKENEIGYTDDMRKFTVIQSPHNILEKKWRQMYGSFLDDAVVDISNIVALNYEEGQGVESVCRLPLLILQSVEHWAYDFFSSSFEWLVSGVNFTEEQREQIKSVMSNDQRRRSGVILNGDAKVQAMPTTDRNKELTQLINWSTASICRFYGVPQHMVGHFSSENKSQQKTEYENYNLLKQTLAFHAADIEQKLTLALFKGNPNLKIKFNFNSYDYMSPAELAQTIRVLHSRAGEGELITINEARSALGLPPLSEEELEEMGRAYND